MNFLIKEKIFLSPFSLSTIQNFVVETYKIKLTKITITTNTVIADIYTTYRHVYHRSSTYLGLSCLTKDAKRRRSRKVDGGEVVASKEETKRGDGIGRG
jgi:hypothetical protein